MGDVAHLAPLSNAVHRKLWAITNDHYRRDMTKGAHGLVVRLLGSRAIGSRICSDPNADFGPQQIGDGEDLFTTRSLPEHIRKVRRTRGRGRKR